MIKKKSERDLIFEEELIMRSGERYIKSLIRAREYTKDRLNELKMGSYDTTINKLIDHYQNKEGKQPESGDNFDFI
jgi:hypothetical protein